MNKKFIKVKNWKNFLNENENENEFENDSFYSAKENYFELYNEQISKIIEDIVYNNKKQQQWKRIPFERMKKIWEKFQKDNIIKDEKGLDLISNIIIKNIVKLNVNTMLSGHSTMNPKDELEELGYKFKTNNIKLEDPMQLHLFKDYKKFKEEQRKEKERELPMTYEEFDEILNDYLYFEEWRQYAISDYALDDLIKIAIKLLRTDDYKEKLILCDNALNISHMRGDIAELFVKGGNEKLSELSGENY